MVATIIFTLLFIIILSALIVFIFNILIPALKQRQVNFSEPLFSPSEVELLKTRPEKLAVSGKRAVVKCSPHRTSGARRFLYNGPKNCALFSEVCDCEDDCRWGCCGFGNCAKACPQEAISIQNATAVINELCIGCGKCIDACPRNLIVLVDAECKKSVLCSALNPLPPNCSVSCDRLAKEEIIEIKSKKLFQLWKKCYTILR